MPRRRMIPAVPFSVSEVSFQSPSSSVPICRTVGGEPLVCTSASKTSSGSPRAEQPANSTATAAAKGRESMLTATLPRPPTATAVPPWSGGGATTRPNFVAAGATRLIASKACCCKYGEAFGSTNITIDLAVAAEADKAASNSAAEPPSAKQLTAAGPISPAKQVRVSFCPPETIPTTGEAAPKAVLTCSTNAVSSAALFRGTINKTPAAPAGAPYCCKKACSKV
mmetsp:Transcript_63719/g.151878  ORF Transcript_63719/g.151878 Transcript_63719/m.151878 type:complete len:225 (-) Transcript_63719:417-1091(-)